MKEPPVKKKDNKLKSDQRKLLNSKMQEYSNKCKRKECFKSKPELKKLNFNLQFANKSKLESLRKNFNMKERNY